MGVGVCARARARVCVGVCVCVNELRTYSGHRDSFWAIELCCYCMDVIVMMGGWTTFVLLFGEKESKLYSKQAHE